MKQFYQKRSGCFFLMACLFCFCTSRAQPGKNGAKIIAAANVVVNEYTALTANAASGSGFIKVASSSINTNNRFAASLSHGDLIMIIQMQGATIKGNVSDSTWGTITSYNNCGLYEFAMVDTVPDNVTINLNCPLLNNYTSTGKVQVVRVPRFTSLTVNTNDTLTCDLWNGTVGGIVAVEVQGNTIIDSSGAINASIKGFRGGPVGSGGPDVNTTFAANSGAGEKGESIAGYATDYNTFGGMYGRGAPANGGGGGNSWNTPGGGGANAGNINAYTGNGNPDTATNDTWITAWNLEYPGFANSTSSGGGRGGYSAAQNDLNPLVVSPNNVSWDPNFYRSNTGGKGGRPLDYSIGRIFFGGGGGGGHEDNGTGGGGGAGGGLVYELSYGTISGAGNIISNGQKGQDDVAINTYADGAGGAGGGGTVILNSTGTVSGISIYTNGGRGGNQMVTNSPLHYESEGGGGGGGGGYIAISNGTINTQALGGYNGTTNAIPMTTFLPNGGTKGGNGLANQIIDSFPISKVNANAGTNVAFCSGASAGLSATGGTTYLWSPSLGLSCDTCSNPVANPANTTTYVVTVSTGTCSGIDSVTVSVLNNPVAGTIKSASDTICQGSSAVLILSGSSGIIQWQSSSTRNNFSNISGADSIDYLTQPAQTTYFRVFADSSFCSDTSLPFMLTVNPLASPIPATNDSVICASDSAQITVNGNYSSYLWSNGDTTSYAYVRQAGNYWVTVTEANGCSAVSTHLGIAVYPVSSVSIVVQGDTLASSNFVSYQWYLSGSVIPAATNFFYVARQSGEYAVLVTDTNGCKTLSSYSPVVINGIAEIFRNDLLNIYPDPFTNTIYIKTEAANSAIQEIKIYDALGRLAMSKVYEPDKTSTNLLILDVSALQQGAYFVKVRTRQGEFNRSIVKE